MQREGLSVTTSPREWNLLLFRGCDLSVLAQHPWTCKLAGACLLATCSYYVVPIPKVYVYVLLLLLIHIPPRTLNLKPNLNLPKPTSLEVLILNPNMEITRTRQQSSFWWVTEALNPKPLTLKPEP